MASNKVRLPMSQGGLQTFHEKSEGEFSFSPDKVVFVSVILILLMIVLLKLNPLGF
jgi:preprotein translocase subunit Sec61beta